VLKDDGLKVRSVETQKELRNLHGHAVVMDILAETCDGRIINVEVQRQKEGFSPKRARYHSSMMDAMFLPKGEEYESISGMYVIILYEKDPLGAGLPLYHVRRTISELENREFGDGAHIILVNGEIIDDTALGRLMHDFFCSDPDEMFYDILRERVKYLKRDKEGVTKMRDITAELIEEGRAFGREEGREETRYETAERMIMENLDYSLISRITHFDEAEIAELAIEVREREAEYSASSKID